MKLDKIKFAWLIAFVTKHGATLGTYEIEDIDALISFDVPTQANANAVEVERLMALMVIGNQKIEAIKCLRNLTGLGLKEAKDAVERHWVSKPADI